MRESDFINKNKVKWSKAELSSAKNKTLLEDYSALSDEASFAQTYFNNRSIRVYLNFLLVKTQSVVLRKRASLDRSIAPFWTIYIPKALFAARNALLLAFLVFCFFTLIGYYSASKDQNFANEVLGNDYVTQSFRNMESGDPMAIYKSMPSHEMFLKIAANNLKVGAFAFALGFIFGIGSLFMMLVNGVMLGTFMHLFYSNGLATAFNLAVWMHGTFEISMLVIEAAAGFILGLGLLNKSTYTSLQSFYRSSKNGIYILIATIPFTIFAAFIESYLTRLTSIPDVFRAFFIVICLLFTLFYFVVYPWLRNRNGAFAKIEDNVAILPNTKDIALPYRVFKNPMLLSLNALKEDFGKHFRAFVGFLFLFMGTLFWMNISIFSNIVYKSNGLFLQKEKWINGLFKNISFLPENFKILAGSTHLLFLALFLALAIGFHLVKVNDRINPNAEPLKWENKLIFLLTFLCSIALFYGIPFIFFVLVSPLLFNAMIAALIEKPKYFLIMSFKLVFKVNNWLSLLNTLILLLMLALLFHSPIFWFLTEIMELFYVEQDLSYSLFLQFILGTLAIALIYIYFLIYAINALPNYYLNKEFLTNNEIKNAINKMEINKQILGFEVE